MSSEVADGWRSAQLAEIATIKTGKTPSTHRPELWGGDIPFVTPSDISDARLVSGVARRLSDEGAAYSTVAPAGSVLFTCIASIGKACVLTETSAFNQQINACIPTSEIDVDFLFFTLKSRTQHLKDMAGTTAVAIINKTTFGQLEVAFPPLDEQQRIAGVLRSVDEAILAAGAASNQWQMASSALLEASFSHGEPTTMGDICSLIYRYPGFYGFEQREAGVPVIRGEHLRAGRISTDWSDFYFVDPDFSAQFPKTVVGLDDVVMSVRGTVGTAAVVDTAHIGSQISPNLIRLVANPQKILPPLLFFAVQSAVAHIRRTIVNAQALPSINAGDLKTVAIALPPLADQPGLLAELIAARDAGADAARAQEQAKRIKVNLMSDLLSGRVRVPA